MGIKLRLTIMQFLQFFIWGAWLISLGGYMGNALHFEGGQIGAIFATTGIAALIMPGLTGIIAALILVLAIGVTYSGTGAVKIGAVSFSGLATAAIVGIALNAVLPGKDYEFGSDLQGDTSVNFKV